MPHKTKRAVPGVLPSALGLWTRPRPPQQLSQAASGSPASVEVGLQHPPPSHEGGFWWALQDLNLRPIGYEPTALTD